MKDFLEYVAKNKYVIICVTIVVALYALGVIEFLSKALVLLALVAIAVFIGKKLQDNDEFFKNIFNIKRYKEYKDVYYYQSKDDNKKE